MTKTNFLSAAFLILAITAYFGNEDTDKLTALNDLTSAIRTP